MTKTTPTARTLKALRSEGHYIDVVERWIGPPGGARVRRDLFGFIDLVAIRGKTLVGIQATTGSNTSSRITKITTDCRAEAIAWLKTGATIEVWGWRTIRARKKSGELGKALRWKPIVFLVELSPYTDQVFTVRTP